MTVYDRFPVKVTGTATHTEPFDPSKYLHEMEIPEWLQEMLMTGWRWEFVEMGGDVKSITAQMLSERTDEELLSVPGIGAKSLAILRAAVKADGSLNPFG